MREALHNLLPITLEEMDSIKLMNRLDTKYLTDEATLVKVLEDSAAAGYRALVTGGSMVIPYNSIYYDTKGLRMFLDHRNQKLNRQKVRTREYVNSRKKNNGRVKKKRIQIPPGEMTDFSTDGDAVSFLERQSDFTLSRLSPVLSTEFDRITLVNPSKTERITIDKRLEFNNFRTGKRASLLDTVIIEIKQDGRAASQMKGILLDHRVKPVRVSKYCVAVTLTDSSARSGRFKEKVRAIEKTINKKITVI